MPNSNRGTVGFQSVEFDDDYDRPSKSQRKREMIALQKTGEQLVNESPDRIHRVPMPDNLKQAILECQKIRHHEGRRRQVQYIGKIMRSLSEDDIARIHEALESWKGLSKADTRLMHALENQREKLLADDKELAVFLQKYPGTDSQQLRTLIRNARKEKAADKPPKAYREIYRLLKQIMMEPSPFTSISSETENEANHGQEN